MSYAKTAFSKLELRRVWTRLLASLLGARCEVKVARRVAEGVRAADWCSPRAVGCPPQHPARRNRNGVRFTSNVRFWPKSGRQELQPIRVRGNCNWIRKGTLFLAILFTLAPLRYAAVGRERESILTSGALAPPCCQRKRLIIFSKAFSYI
jgi:hypothetical protein